MKLFISFDKKYGFLVYPWIFSGEGYKLKLRKLLLFFILTLFINLTTNLFFIFEVTHYSVFHRCYLDNNLLDVKPLFHKIVLSKPLLLDKIVLSKPLVYLYAYIPRPLTYFIGHIQFCLQTLCLLKLLKAQEN